MDEIMINVSGVSKQYKLGQIGGTTLRDEMQRFRANLLHKEDPTAKIGMEGRKRGEVFLALSNVSFSVKQGERVGIIGHNGAGKSTLLKLISRVTAPTEGVIGLNGRIASMLEVGTGFHGELTGRENIYMNGAILGMTKSEIDDKIEAIIDFSECRQFIDTPVKRYSSGMYVKLAFSVAAHLNSEIMIMDEVLAVGDMAFQKKCLDKMNDVSRKDGKTILYVSHNMSTIRQLCDRCIVLNHGQIVFDGETEIAISRYLENMDSDDPAVDYTRSSALILYDNKLMTKLSAQLRNKESNVFVNELSMPISFVWQNQDKIEALCLRIELRKSDRTIIGTCFAYDIYSGEKQEVGAIDVSVDISSLVSGVYSTTYTFFLKDQFGSNLNVLCVKGINFRVVRDQNDIVWDYNTWGSVRFPDIIKIVDKSE